MAVSAPPADAAGRVNPRGGAARGESFPKACRILRRAEFLRIQHQGLRIHGKRLVFQFLPGATRESRLGITVSRKVGNAVVRNRIKRWIRETFRRHPELRPPVDQADPRRAYDLVITAKRDVGELDWRGVHDEIVGVLQRFLAERGRKKPPKKPEPPLEG